MEPAPSLPSEVRTLRRLDPPDSPWPGALATREDGASVLVVDGEALADWPGWSVEGAEHLLSVIDVVRRPDGHDALLPACTETVQRFVARRRGHGAPLADGEVVTIAASIVRGVGEALERGLAREAATWWLTAEGRPMLVLGAGSDIGAASAEVLDRVVDAARGDAGDLATLVRQARDAVRDPRRLRVQAGLDAALLGAAKPRALDRSRAPDAAAGARPPTWTQGRARTTGESGTWLIDLRDRVARFVDDARVRVRGRGAARNGRQRRKGPLLVMLVVAIAAIGGMLLLWPADDSPPERSPAPASTGGSRASSIGPSEPSTPASEPSTPAPEPSDTPAPDVAMPAPVADPAAATSALLTERTACGGAVACLRAVVEDPSRAFPAGPIDLAEQDRSVTLLDSFGGVAVVRVVPKVGSAGSVGQIVVVVAGNDGWLLRDVHDVAEQPS